MPELTPCAPLGLALAPIAGVIANLRNPSGELREGVVIISRIKESNLLIREAEATGRSVQRSLDNLIDALSKGNMNPGLGSKSLGSGISYARARDGARVFFRQVENQIEILGKSAKDNEQKVINEVQKLFGGK